ncbi:MULTISPECIES: HD family hydrolase [unclassified Streptomyces]|uniref:HD domain-containing protein n=1 Tax=unclassified Streptomyces TaxID=2593676 RepID=UPI0022540F42|nr:MULTISPECIES: HD domain-containing protein [unclassified Streptomyces]MCX4993376.1 HD domain-containing protein [Streptomyces sp. NBC_00568]MCX5009165.1 HD domain-containing protein [Streptomyces sp. NBC_00638]
MSEDLTAVARFLYEAGTLKNTARTGWWMAGVKEPESVADHSWRTALIATIIAKLEGADPARAAFLAVWHDSQESRTGDVNYLGRKYAPQADPRHVTADQVAQMPEILAQAVRELIDEYEAKETPEAVCARDADKLECLIQGIEYKAQGYQNAQRWIDNSRSRLTTKTAHALAEAVLETDSLDWLRTALGESNTEQA